MVPAEQQVNAGVRPWLKTAVSESARSPFAKKHPILIIVLNIPAHSQLIKLIFFFKALSEVVDIKKPVWCPQSDRMIEILCFPVEVTVDSSSIRIPN